MNDINQLRRTFRTFWLRELLPVLLQLGLRDYEVTMAQHRAWKRWREASEI